MVFLYIGLTLITICFVYIKWNNSFWTRRNVQGPKPLPLFGNYLDYFLMRKHYGIVNDDIYKKHENAAYVGIYRFGFPAVLIRDLNIIKSVLIENFNNFTDNDFAVDESIDPLLATSPFFTSGNKWKVRRSQTSPAFTTAKLKAIFPSIQETSKKFVEYLNRKLDNNVTELDAKNVSFRFAISNVASCLISLEANAFADQESEFANYSRRIFETTFQQFVRLVFSVLIPSLNKLFRTPLLPIQTDKWFRSIINQVIVKRMAGERRNDFFQTLMDSQAKSKDIYNDTELIGHSFTFLVEGFESSNITIAYCLFEIAAHKDVQAQVRDEIDTVLAENNGEWTEEWLSKLTYLEKVIFESMRKNTPVFALSKLCTKSFQLPPQLPGDKTGYIVEVGVPVVIPVHSIHNDPTIYPNPHIFDPSRFDEDEVNRRHKCAFIPFGEGPRICIGMKFAMLQVKMALVSIIANFIVNPSPTNKLPLETSAKAMMLHCEHGIWVKLQKRVK